MEHRIDAIVVDVGSNMVKAGFGGDDAPRAYFPSTIGTAKTKSCMVGMGNKSYYVGDEAQYRRGSLTMCHVLEHAIPQSNDLHQRLFHQSFYNELKVAPEEHPLLILEATLNPLHVRQNTLQLLMEEFSAPAVYFANASIMSLYAHGKTSGMAVDCGHGITQMVPVCDGLMINAGQVRSELGGALVSRVLMEMLWQSNKPASAIDMQTTAWKQTLHQIKEKAATCSTATHTKSSDYTYDLPDGTKIKVSAQERQHCMNVLFQPEQFNKLQSFGKGIQHCIHRALQMYKGLDTDNYLHDSLLNNIIVSGGVATAPFFQERLSEELSKLENKPVQILQKTKICKYAPWIGASLLSDTGFFDRLWTSREEYEEVGPSIAQKH